VDVVKIFVTRQLQGKLRLRDFRIDLVSKANYGYGKKFIMVTERLIQLHIPSPINSKFDPNNLTYHVFQTCFFLWKK
jgi:hypothetical protein